MFSLFKPPAASSRGFTIIEVMVSIAVVAVISALILARYGAFNSTVLLKNQAFEIALDIREAQALAVSVKGGDGGSGTEFRQEYGIEFSRVPAGGQNSYYTFFLDQDDTGDDSEGGDRRFDYFNPENEQVGPPRTLDSRFIITQLCSPSCQSNNVIDGKYLTISFRRPDFDAYIEVYKNNNKYVYTESAEIVIANIKDLDFTQSIFITSTGQITVK